MFPFRRDFKHLMEACNENGFNFYRRFTKVDNLCGSVGTNMVMDLENTKTADVITCS